MATYTQAQIDDLSEAISSGVLTVQYANGKRITYHSLSEMRSLLSEMQADVAGTNAVPRHSLAGFSRD